MLHFECFCVKRLNLITHKNGKNLIAFFFFRVKERFSEVPAGGRLQLVFFFFFFFFFNKTKARVKKARSLV